MVREVIFCVDSDGCAMDTMTYKHKLFFGPLIRQFFPIDNPEKFQQDWEKMNLYSRTRGVNRFVGLGMALEKAGVTGISNLLDWIAKTDSLSNASLEAALNAHPSQDLQAALDWSNAVNQAIKFYEGQALAFPLAKEGLAKLSQLGKVYVVSSANRGAVEEEWVDQGLLSYVTDLYCQDKGKKEDVIASLIKELDSPRDLLMIGDSPGDCQAAELNNALFYPIIVGQEEASWSELLEKEAQSFVDGSYQEDSYKQKFWENLDK